MADGKNRRKDMRTKLSAKVKLMHPALGEVLLNSGDVSDGGVMLYTTGIIAPAIGEIVKIQMTGMPIEAPIVTMKVVRHVPDGIGLEFVLNEP